VEHHHEEEPEEEDEDRPALEGAAQAPLQGGAAAGGRARSLSKWAGIGRTNPWIAGAMLIFLLSIALGIVTVVASVILWLFLQASGAFTGVNQLISSLGTGSTTVDISQMISLGQVALVTTIFAVVNTVVFTLLGMIAAILYNLAAKLVGGVTLTLSDES